MSIEHLKPENERRYSGLGPCLHVPMRRFIMIFAHNSIETLSRDPQSQSLYDLSQVAVVVRDSGATSNVAGHLAPINLSEHAEDRLPIIPFCPFVAIEVAVRAATKSSK